MSLLHEIVAGLPDGRVETIGVGDHWTAVVVEQDGRTICGLASNPVKGVQADESFRATLAGLKKRNALDLCNLGINQPPPLSSIGLAAINALLPLQPEKWVDRNAGDVIAQKGQGKRVALVGHFPFVPELHSKVGELHVLELRPQEGDLHASEAPRIIPQADVVALTSMAFVNGTMDGLLKLCSPNAYVIVLGPSTPLSPLLFAHGIDMLCGSIVENINPVVKSILNGDGFQQVKRHGVRLVTIEK